MGVSRRVPTTVELGNALIGKRLRSWHHSRGDLQPPKSSPSLLHLHAGYGNAFVQTESMSAQMLV